MYVADRAELVGECIGEGRGVSDLLFSAYSFFRRFRHGLHVFIFISLPSLSFVAASFDFVSFFAFFLLFLAFSVACGGLGHWRRLNRPVVFWPILLFLVSLHF